MLAGLKVRGQMRFTPTNMTAAPHERRSACWSLWVMAPRHRSPTRPPATMHATLMSVPSPITPLPPLFSQAMVTKGLWASSGEGHGW